MTQGTTQQEIFCTFCHKIKRGPVAKLLDFFADQTADSDVGAIHLLFQSNGGDTNQGVVLFNYFRALPIDLHIYNAGGIVASAALTAFIGAKYRHASTHAMFVFHKANTIMQFPMTAAQLREVAHITEIDEKRIVNIFKSVVQMPPEKWSAYETTSYVPITAQDAQQYGLITPPFGSRVFNI